MCICLPYKPATPISLSRTKGDAGGKKKDQTLGEDKSGAMNRSIDCITPFVEVTRYNKLVSSLRQRLN
jgi:hypothetical protein